MKILFLQYWYDMFGGAETVNHTLASQFKKDGYDVKIECMYKCGNNEIISDITYEKNYICDEPVRPSYKEMIKNFVKLNGQFIVDLKKVFHFYKLKNKSYEILKTIIKSYKPDWIIITNIELIKYVPKPYLKKCLIHIHSNIDEYMSNKKLKKSKKLLFKYQNKVYKLIFLTEGFVKRGIYYNLTNSTYIYNPVRIKSYETSKLDSKNAIFIGRLDPVKRIPLLSEIFNDFLAKNKDWNLNIYGKGNTKGIITNNNIKLCGTTNNVKEKILESSIFTLTSSYEGFPMVILEAYECGVPVIAFDYKTSCDEIIKNGITGFIIRNDDKEEYIEKLSVLCNDKALRVEMGRNAKKFVKQFYPEIIAKRWYKLFKGDLNEN